jgi:hypothetical protein
VWDGIKGFEGRELGEVFGDRLNRNCLQGVVFEIGVSPELLIIGILREQMTAIANIDLVF